MKMCKKIKMETLFFIFVALFISSVEGFYYSEPNPCQYHYTHGTRRHLFSDPSNCARYYDCSYYKEYGYGKIRTEHLHCPQGKSFVRTLPNGQSIEAGGACIGPHPSNVFQCQTHRGEIF